MILRSNVNEAYTNQKLKQRGPINQSICKKTEIERFRNWIKLGDARTDRDRYFLDGKVCVDYFIRFECLIGGVTEVCNRLSIPESEISLPTFKKGIRNA